MNLEDEFREPRNRGRGESRATQRGLNIAHIPRICGASIQDVIQIVLYNEYPLFNPFNDGRLISLVLGSWTSCVVATFAPLHTWPQTEDYIMQQMLRAPPVAGSSP